MNNYVLDSLIPAYTSKVPVNVVQMRPDTSNQKRGVEDYFATTISTQGKNYKGTPKGIQRESSENSKRNNGGKFFTKIQNLLLKKTDTKKIPREPKQKNSSSKDPELRVIKGTLMKTINLHIKQTTSAEKRTNAEQEQAGKLINSKGKNENSSAEGKSASTYQSDTKLVKSKASTKNADVGASPSINKLKQNTLDFRQLKPLTKIAFENSGAATTRTKEKTGEVGTPSVRNSSNNKNPDYFEIQKAHHDTLVRSPAHKSFKSTFNVAKILSAIKEKDSAIRSSASLLKPKVPVIPQKNIVRQTSSNIKYKSF